MGWVPLAIGAGVGLLKNMDDTAKADAQRKAQAETTRYSPWTGMHGQAVQDPSLFGNVATGAAVGGQLGQAANAMPSTTPSGSPAVPIAPLGNSAPSGAPYALGQSTEGTQNASDMAKYGMVNNFANQTMGGGGSAGALSPWSTMGQNPQGQDMLSMYKNLFANQPRSN